MAGRLCDLLSVVIHCLASEYWYLNNWFLVLCQPLAVPQPLSYHCLGSLSPIIDETCNKSILHILSIEEFSQFPKRKKQSQPKFYFSFLCISVRGFIAWCSYRYFNFDFYLFLVERNQSCQNVETIENFNLNSNFLI